MALKDITLGQYFPGNTLLHRLDPRTKLLFTVAYIVALFLAKHVVGYAVLFVLLAVLIAVSKVGIKSILRGMKPILIIVIITGLLNLFYTRGEGAPLVSFWIFTIYPEGIWAAVFMVLRIAMLITCTFLLTYTTSPILLTDGLFSLFLITVAAGLALVRLSTGAIDVSDALAIVLTSYVLLEPLDHVGAFFYVGMAGMANQRAIRRILSRPLPRSTARPGAAVSSPAAAQSSIVLDDVEAAWDADPVLEGVNLAGTGANGKRVVQNLLDAITPILQDGAAQHLQTAAANARAEADAARAAREQA